MITKKIKVLVLAGLVMFTGATTSAMAETQKHKDNGIKVEEKADGKFEEETCIGEKFEDLSFEDCFGDMKDILKKDEYKKLETMFNKCKKLDKNEKYEESDKLWDEMNSIVDKYYKEQQIAEIDNWTIDDLFQGYKDIVKGEDCKKLEKLFEEVKEYEKQEKYEESNKVWEKIDGILEKYYEQIQVDDIKDWKMEDCFQGYKEIMKVDDYKALEKLFQEVKEYEIQGKSEEGEKIWNKIDQLLQKYDSKFEDGDIEEGKLFEDDMFSDDGKFSDDGQVIEK